MTLSTRWTASASLVAVTVTAAFAFHSLSCRAAPAPGAPISGETRESKSPRTVTVSGRAEILTTPDELTIHAGIQVYDTSVKTAKKESDRRAKALLDIATAHGVEAKWVQTDDFRIYPRLDGSYESRRVLGYDVHKKITITVHDVATLEGLLLEMFENGANQLDGVQMQTSKLAELRKQAREQALKAAKDKAELATSVLGQRLGRPLKIDESPESGFGGYYGRAQIANYQAGNETNAVSGESTALGKIKVDAAVSVVFEIED